MIKTPEGRKPNTRKGKLSERLAGAAGCFGRYREVIDLRRNGEAIAGIRLLRHDPYPIVAKAPSQEPAGERDPRDSSSELRLLERVRMGESFRGRRVVRAVRALAPAMDARSPAQVG